MKPTLRYQAAVLAAAFCAGCFADPPIQDVPGEVEHREEIESWRRERDQSLRKEDGWLTLAGLYWLEEGDNTFGSDEDNDLVFPAGKIPGTAGILRRDGREVWLFPASGVELQQDGSQLSARTPLTLDTSDEGPTIVSSGSLSFHAIERSEMIGIRLKDRENSVLERFDGMSYFPIDLSRRVVARYELFDQPRILETPNVLGTVSEETIHGEVVFELDGETFKLQPSGDPADGFFLVFGDRTNGAETYGGGRFLYTEPVAEDDSVVVDFNKAYCPPCVFTPYATCPLPPAANKLALRVEAGEKMFGAAH